MTQSIKTLSKFLFLFIPFSIKAQTSYIQLGDKSYHLLDRLDIKSNFSGFNSSYIKPVSSRLLVKAVLQLDSLQRNGDSIGKSISTIDKYQMNRFLMNNKEYTGSTSSYMNKKGPFNLIEVKKKQFFWVLNPALQAQQTVETGQNQSVYLYSAGLKTRALIGKNLSLDFYGTLNQERTPSYVRDFTKQYHAIPGFSNYDVIQDSTGYQYLDIRGSVQWSLAKFMEVQVGYDRNFLGNGIRSLLLSDFSGSALFARLSTRVWKFRFDNFYMKLTPQFDVQNKSTKKYLRVNTLSIDVAKGVNIGVFDAVVLGRDKQFELNYIQPFTFLRAMEQQSGSPDNALLGVNFKANIKKTVQVYGQLLLDEFLLKEIKAKNNYWANKYGYQIGAKYIDAFKVKNLDLQFEMNRVRTFTYTHYDTVANYSNNSMPLAHQLGAGFQEYIGVVKYQPNKKVWLQSKFVYYTQGKDTAGVNMGNNILLNYFTRPKDYGWVIGSGNTVHCLYFTINASYELKENLFLDAGLAIRNYTQDIGKAQTTSLFSVGFRWNINKREFDF